MMAMGEKKNICLRVQSSTSRRRWAYTWTAECPQLSSGHMWIQCVSTQILSAYTQALQPFKASKHDWWVHQGSTRTETAFECLLTRLKDGYMLQKLWVLLWRGSHYLPRLGSDSQRDFKVSGGNVRETLKDGLCCSFMWTDWGQYGFHRGFSAEKLFAPHIVWSQHWRHLETDYQCVLLPAWLAGGTAVSSTHSLL